MRSISERDSSGPSALARRWSSPAHKTSAGHRGAAVATMWERNQARPHGQATRNQHPSPWRASRPPPPARSRYPAVADWPTVYQQQRNNHAPCGRGCPCQHLPAAASKLTA
jgi:hypothetical protein